MTLLEHVMLARAEEQLVAEAWRRADRGEHLVKVPPPPCQVCGAPSAPVTKSCRGVPNPADLCQACRRAGWRSRRCACGRPLHTRDYGSNSKTVKRASACRTCRLAEAVQ